MAKALPTDHGGEPRTAISPVALAVALLLLLAGGPAPCVGSLAAPAPARAQVPAAGASTLADPVDEQVWRGAVAPGIDLLMARRLDDRGWLDFYALVVDLDTPGVGVTTLTGPSLTERLPLSQLASDRAEVVAAVNGDFFHAGASGAPVGFTVAQQEIWKGPYPDPRPSLALIRDPAGRLRATVGYWQIQAQVECPRQPASLPIHRWNEPAPRPGDVTAFDARWGPVPLPLQRWAFETGYALLTPMPGADRWLVSRADRGVPARPPQGTERTLLGWREGARELAGCLQVGDLVTMTVTPQARWLRPAVQGVLENAVSGSSLLLQDGTPVIPDNHAGAPDQVHPRTAAGVSHDGRRLILAVADGRRSFSRGLTAAELAAWLLRLGAVWAVNLDGGGSSEMLAALGAVGLSRVNELPQLTERALPVAIGLTYRRSGQPGPTPGVPSFVLKPALPPLPAGGARGYPLAPAGAVGSAGVPLEVMPWPQPPSPADLVWAVSPGDLGFFAGPGRFIPLRAGSGRIFALQPGHDGAWAALRSVLEPSDVVRSAALQEPQRTVPAASLPVQIHDRPVRLSIDPSPLKLWPGLPAPFSLFLVDSRGFRTPVDPRQVTLWVDGPALGKVTGQRVEAWPVPAQVTAGAPQATAPHDPAIGQDDARPDDAGPRLAARYLDLSASAPIAWRSQDTPVFDDPPDWRVLAAPGPPGPAATERASRPSAPHAGSPPAAPPDGAGGSPGLRVAAIGAVTGSLDGLWQAWAQTGAAGGAPRPPVDLLLLAGNVTQAAGGLDGLARWLGQQGMPPSIVAPGEEERQSGGLGAFMQQMGAPNRVARRGDTLFIVFDPATEPWTWLLQELRRFRSEGLQRLVVLLAAHPLCWNDRRTGEMFHAWLSELARTGSADVWVLFARQPVAAGSLGAGVWDDAPLWYWLEGVRYVPVSGSWPPPGPGGSSVLLLTFYPGQVRLERFTVNGMAAAAANPRDGRERGS